MATTELNFGPKWLRALSDGVTKNPPTTNSSSSSSLFNNSSITSASFKSKIVSKSSSPSSVCSMKPCGEVKYRYSREEMLSYLNRSLNAPPPKDLIQHDEVYVEQAQNPLALTEPSGEEINLLSQINSDFVLKKSNPGAEPGGDILTNAGGSRIKVLNANHELPMNRTGSVGERSKLGTGGNNGFPVNTDRTNAASNSYPTRPPGARGGSVSGNGRSTVRNSNNIVFTRFSSTDDTNGGGGAAAAAAGGGGGAPKTNPLFIPKKGAGLQRSGENNSLSPSFGSHPWRSGSTTTSNSAAANNNNGEAKEWKTAASTQLSSSESVKNWRNDSGNVAVGPSPSYVSANSKSSRKDFFADDGNPEAHDTRKPGNGGIHNSKSKPFAGRRLTSVNNNAEHDLFAAADADRDLFGGRNGAGGNQPIALSGLTVLEDLVGGRNTNTGKSALNRFPSNREYRDSSTNSSSNHYRNDRSYSRFGGNNQYDRFGSARSNAAHNDESDWFRARGGSEDPSSLPEWSLDDPGSIDVTRVGTFDANGAFHEAIEDNHEEQRESSPPTKQTLDPDASDEKAPKKVASQDSESNANHTPQETVPKAETQKSSALDPETGDGSKSKIDYFNDPTLSPDYRSKSTDDDFSTSKPNEVRNDDFNQDPQETLSRNPPRAKSQEMAEESVFSELLMKSGATGGNAQVFVKTDSENLPGFVAYSHQQPANNERHVTAAASFSIKPPGQDTGPGTLDQRDVSVVPPPALFGSMLKHPPDETNNDRLLNTMKLSSLLNEFNLLDFDQKANRIRPTDTGNTVNAVSTSPMNKNRPEELFLRLASSQELSSSPIIKPSMESFIGENMSVRTQPPSQAGFSVSGFLQDLVDHEPSSTSPGPTFGSDMPARFSNMLKQTVPGAKPSTLVSVGNELKIDSGAERQQHNQATIMATKWFYCDPQGQTQGPFTSQEMYDWDDGGYFASDLLVKRTTDASFVKLGELKQACGGRCPFIINLPPLPGVRTGSPVTGSRSVPPHHPSSAEFLRNEAPSLFPSFSQQQNSHSQAGMTAGPPHHQPPIMNRFLSQQPPPASAANHSFAGSTAPTNSFPMDDSLLNTFGFIHNLKSSQANSSTANNNIPSMGVATDRIADLIQQQQQRHGHQSNSDVNTTGRQHLTSDLEPPPSNQMQMFLNHLMQPSMATKEDLMALTSQQREQYLLEKFQQFNMTHDKDQLRQQALNEQYHLNQTMPPAVERMYSSMEDGDRNDTATRVMPKKHSLEESRSAAANNGAPVQLQRAQSQEPSNDFVLHSQQNNRNYSFHHQPPETSLQWYGAGSGPAPQNLPPQGAVPVGVLASFKPPDQPPEATLQWLKKYGNTVSPPPGTVPLIAPSADKFVPGALSVSDVEELQRREVEEHYRNQKQQQQQPAPVDDTAQFGEADCGEFIEVDRKQKHRQVNNKQPKHKNNLQPAKESVPVKPSSPQNVPGSGVTVPSPNAVPAIPQMPQLPKKAVWGSQSDGTAEQPQTQSQPLSIAEIQRIQEEKEEEERRQRDLQQMNSLVMQQQQRSQLKWASQPWKEQNVSNIKTLAEIQAEEAEKQAAIMRKEAMDSKRRSVPSGPTPLSVIVAKGGQTGAAWGGSPPKPMGTWGDEEDSSYAHAIPANSSLSVNYKNAVAAGQKANIASWRQILKANPKVVKKIEDSELNLRVESREDLLRISAELLNRHFDPVEANAFISIVKDLGSPAEVNELCQLYLGSNAASNTFSRFFIMKKSYLLKKQHHEQERGKQQSHAGTANQQSQAKKSTWNTDDDDHRTVNYKSALNSNQQQPGKGGSSSNRTTAAHIKAAALKPAASKTRGSDEVNIMTLQVESMEEFDKWCLDVLKLNFELNIDAETFVNFLKDIASPDEINDYVQTYLGSNKTSRDFAKNFIAKRSYLRNKAKQHEPYEDMCGPAPALTPSVNSASNDNNGFVTVSSSNKKKRNKNKNQNHD